MFQHQRMSRLSLRGLVVAAGGLFAAVVLVACGSDGDSAAVSSTRGADALQKINAVDRIYTVDDLRAAGMKTSKQFDVTGLTGAVDVWFGFFTPPGDTVRDYEVRFFPSHGDAVKLGTALAEEGSGEDAKLLSRNATWQEGLSERTWYRVSGLWAEFAPKYMDYVIYGNMILLCEGLEPASSVGRCGALIDAVEAAHAS